MTAFASDRNQGSYREGRDLVGGGGLGGDARVWALEMRRPSQLHLAKPIRKNLLSCRDRVCIEDVMHLVTEQSLD